MKIHKVTTAIRGSKGFSSAISAMRYDIMLGRKVYDTVFCYSREQHQRVMDHTETADLRLVVVQVDEKITEFHY